MLVSDLQLNDPVQVNRDSRQFEGVVAYLGDVHFDTGGDWVGVRLTGNSVNQGKNDGSVKGVSYFSNCPPNCGIFVKASAVTKRTLNRLETLRLKRELAKSGGGGAAAAAAPAAPSSSSSGIRTPTRIGSAASSRSSTPGRTPTEASAAAAAADSTTPAAAGRSRLEELRKRRAALQERKGDESVSSKPPPAADAAATEPAPAAAAAAPSTTEATNKEQEERLRQLEEQLETVQKESTDQLADLQEQLRVSKSHTSELEQKLAAAEQEAANAKASAASVAAAQVNASAAAAAPTSGTAVVMDNQALEQLQQKDEQLQEKEHENRELNDRLEEALQDVSNSRRDLQREQQTRAAEQEDLAAARTKAATLEKEIQAMTEQSTQRGQSDASHYKERAKLQAEVSAVKRVVEQMEKDKQELENTIEDLALDKDQLQAEKEALEDRYEEARLDAETAQLQVDELRMELEDAQMAAERSASLPTESAAESSMDAEDKAHALATQNARLREALIRLREQSSVEKLEASRQLRAAEEAAEEGKELISETESLRELKINMEEQINDLKDMVEQGAAFESMVEDLSDRVMTLEEDNVLLQSTIREMEEAAELTEEMEEVQAEEMKALAQDLEGRDTIIRNLEEAIKMQRRREEDFRRTVGNYRTTVDTLKMEKQALLDLQAGGEGEKSSLIASSQKALSKAAQLVADAADMRKREAQAVMDKIDRQIYRHLSTRLESLLPHASVSSEIVAVKGEMLTSKVVSKAAQSLMAISKSFASAIRPPIPDDKAGAASGEALSLSDEMKSELAVTFHQTDFALELSEVSSSFVRFLAAGQWPDQMSADASAELGSLLGHTLPELDSVLGQVLKTLKEEGSLSIEQSNIGLVQQAARNALQSLESDLMRKDGSLVPPEWSPPGLTLMKDVSISKFSVLGAAAALSSVVHSPDQTGAGAPLQQLYNRVEQCSSQIGAICLRLASLDVKNSKLVEDIAALVTEVTASSRALLQSVKDTMLSEGELAPCEAAVDKALRELARLSAVLRSSSLNQNDDGRYHPLSPEGDDTWERLSGMAQDLRAIDGDVEDVNFALRARQVEHRLDRAVENEPKLETAQTKIATLEKNIASRNKEIAMQNARLSELERVLAKSNSSPAGRGHSADVKSSEEYNRLNEENRVLLEAMDVLQRQVDEYEHEIRVLKDFKTPSKRNLQGRGTPHANRTPRRALTSVSDLTSPGPGTDELMSSNYSLEATLFRPALQQALEDSWKWKAVATSKAMAQLPPLPPPLPVPGPENLMQLSSAISDARLKKASIRIVDLRNTKKTPRAQLMETRHTLSQASSRLAQAMRSRASQ